MGIFNRWFKKQSERHTDDSQNPWAGLASYEDPATTERKLKSCGRDDDSYDVAKLIMGNIFVTLYGKSGIGKTSLLNAGVFPELREEQYTPISLRLGMRDEDHPKSYQSVIIETIERAACRYETINVIDEQKDEQAVDYLWNYFARHRFFDKNDDLTTPVVVMDQFEEVFRSDSKEVENLLRQLDYINDRDHALDCCTIDNKPYRYEQNYRFVVSIREDDLYRLEDSLDNCYLPALKRCRYRLRSLTEQGARDAILIPGDGLFTKEGQDEIIKAIVEKSRNADGSISTNLISLLCSRIYSDYRSSNASHITKDLVDTFIQGNPFEKFYNEATRGFSYREKSYIEDNLVDSTGRRNSIPESDFLRYVKNGAVLMEGSRRILQRTNTSSDGNNYRVELIHDSFCEPLALLKEEREQRRKKMWLATVYSVALLCMGIMGLFIYLMQKNLSQEEKILFTQQSLFQTETQKDSIQSQNDYVQRLNDSITSLNLSLSEQMDLIQHQKDSITQNLIALQLQQKEILAQKDTIRESQAAQAILQDSLKDQKQELREKDNTLKGLGVFNANFQVKIHNMNNNNYHQEEVYYAYFMSSEKAVQIENEIKKCVNQNNTYDNTRQIEKVINLNGFMKSYNGIFSINAIQGMNVLVITEDEYITKRIVINGRKETYKVTIDVMRLEGVEITRKRKQPTTRTDTIILSDGYTRYHFSTKLPHQYLTDDTRVVVRPYAISCQTEDTLDALDPIFYEGKKYNRRRIKKGEELYPSTILQLQPNEDCIIDTLLLYSKRLKDKNKDYRVDYQIIIENHRKKVYTQIELGTCLRISPFKFIKEAELSPKQKSALNILRVFFSVSERTSTQEREFQEALKELLSVSVDYRAIIYTELETLDKRKDAATWVNMMDDQNPTKWYLKAILWAEKETAVSNGIPYYLAYLHHSFKLDSSYYNHYRIDANFLEELRKKYPYRKEDNAKYEKLFLDIKDR